MKKVAITIPFVENQNLPILAALKTIRNYSDLEFEKVGELLNLFHDRNDICCSVSTVEMDLLVDTLKSDGFTITLLECK